MAVRAASLLIGRFVPFKLAGRTPQWAAWFLLDGPPLDFERLAEDDCLGDFAARDFYDPSESRARDSHPLCRLLLVEPLEISQSDSFEFIESYHYLCEHPRRNSSRLEYRRRRFSSYSAATWRPGHNQNLHVYYKHMIITVKMKRRDFEEMPDERINPLIIHARNRIYMIPATRSTRLLCFSTQSI
jgi:hypothetical protein